MAQTIQWYPGHMTKTRRRMESDLKMVDAVVEIIDARIPISSRNPEIDALTAGKPRIVLLNKADYADAAATDRWCAWFKAKGVAAIACDCRSGKGLGRFSAAVRELLAEQIARWQAKGMKGHYIKLMIVGIPNVGKSSFINRMAKSAKAKAADRPGVTRGNQWFTIDGNIELLDTPGVLWPKFEDPQVGLRLAFTGAVKDNVLDVEELCAELVRMLAEAAPEPLKARYKLDDIEGLSAGEVIELIARKRGMLISGGEPDIERACATILDEYRGGKLGRLTLELPPKE
ncbi:MAG: ribosome biogenesis GTPase YlqF [Ruminococcaceae bacterium]|nr:ribosome biogenesis GTPase YlqF [Oscillospiraceae bacterium]